MAETATLNLGDIGYVHRIIIGSQKPDVMQLEEDAERSLNELNRCLTENPKGRIVGIERSYTVLNVGEHQLVLQTLIYHIGFRRQPLWLPAKNR